MCKTLSILNMNCFSGESCAVMREIKLKGKYLEYLYILIEEDWLKRVTVFHKMRDVSICVTKVYSLLGCISPPSTAVS